MRQFYELESQECYLRSLLSGQVPCYFIYDKTNKNLHIS
jgi:hypothetical protein